MGSSCSTYFWVTQRDDVELPVCTRGARTSHRKRPCGACARSRGEDEDVPACALLERFLVNRVVDPTQTSFAVPPLRSRCMSSTGRCHSMMFGLGLVVMLGGRFFLVRVGVLAGMVMFLHAASL